MREPDKLFTDGAAYERLMGRWSRVVARTFLGWLNVPNNLRWLDVGCGNGAFTEELIARCAPAAVTAIDPSDDQLAYARTRPGVGVADFRVGDAQNLPFADNSFDVATMALVISFLPDPGRAVTEMARAVRPESNYRTLMRLAARDVRFSPADAAENLKIIVKACIDHKTGLTTGGHNVMVPVIENDLIAKCLTWSANLLRDEIHELRNHPT